MKKLNKDIFQSYTSDDDLRPPMKEISLQHGYVYATDGHLLIRAKKEDVEFTPEEVEDYPNANKIIESNIKSNDQKFDIPLQDIKKALSQCPKEDVHKTIKCDHCNGEGYEYCIHCRNETECEECQGNGELITDEIIGERYSLHHHIKIKGKWYKPKLWDEITTTAEQLNEDVLTYHHQKGNQTKPGLIEIGPAQILVMITIVHDEEHAKYTEIPVSDDKKPA